MGPGVAQWLRHCATSRKVSGSIPSGVTGDLLRSYRWNHVPWGRLSLQKWVQGKTPGGKDGRCVRVTTLPPSECRNSRKSGALTCRIPKGLIRPVVGKLYLYLLQYKWVGWDFTVGSLLTVKPQLVWLDVHGQIHPKITQSYFTIFE
jgi:hypothetical protein